MTLTAHSRSPGLWFAEEAITEAENRALVERLLALPVNPPGSPLDVYRLAFRSLVLGGEPVEGRREAACGSPIWDGHGPSFGAPVPAWLSDVLPRVDGFAGSAVSDHLGFSSVYVDWYEQGGTFVPHTDRDIYGPLVCGLSAGEGNALIRFTDGHDVVDLTLPARSIYCFGPPLRDRPWTHEIVSVSARRLGVTFRTAAA